MVKDLVGYRFSPTGYELINHYLKNKILGKTWLVDDAISEINLCSYEPFLLPSLSKIKSEDPVWYFFSPKEYTTAKKNVTKRTTSSGYWKATGVDRKIKNKRGYEIGIKKTLVYYEGRVPKGVRTPWVMHEYHITSLPQDQRTYVICQVMYKGEDGDFPSVNNSSEPSQSLVFDSNTVRTRNTPPEVEQAGQDNYYCLSMYDLLNPLNKQEDLSPCDGFEPNTLFSNNYNNNNNPAAQQETPYGDDYWNELLDYNGGNFEDVIPDEGFLMQEHRNDYKPKKSLSGIIVDFSSDSDKSDAESISATSYQETSSPDDSVDSSNRHFSTCSSKDSCKDRRTSTEPSISRKTREYQLTRHTVPSKQEVKQGISRSVDASMDNESSVMKTEKKGLFILKEAMERNSKKPRYIYLVNVIIGFILLLSLIGNIISVLLNFKS